MKRNGEKKTAKVSKMSLAAKKAWQTRRKKSEKKAGAGSWASKKQSEIDDEPEITVEQLKRAYRRSYRKGFLQLKGKRGQRKGGAVKIDKKLREYLEFLYGRQYFEEIIIQRLWAEAKRLVRQEMWQELEEPKLVSAK